MKHDAWKAQGEPIDDGGNQTRGQKWGTSDSHFPSRRVGEKSNVVCTENLIRVDEVTESPKLAK